MLESIKRRTLAVLADLLSRIAYAISIGVFWATLSPILLCLLLIVAWMSLMDLIHSKYVTALLTVRNAKLELLAAHPRWFFRLRILQLRWQCLSLQTRCGVRHTYTSIARWLDTASGSLVGYQKDEVWFSEKNTYYAFPLKARHKFESRVVDVCVDRDLVVVFTCEGIWMLNDSVDCRDAGCRQGQQMSMSYPLIGPRACTVTPAGIVYASTEGLHLIQEGGERLVSRAAFDRNSW